MTSLLNEKIHLDVNVYRKNVFEIIDDLKDYILNEECEEISIDISKLNFIDASKISILCSTYHFSKYPKGEITWIVKDKETKRTIKLLKLKNIKTEIKQNKKINQLPQSNIKTSKLRLKI